MERNVTLDFVRGVAILGILLLNISAFGLPKAAYLNPARYGAITSPRMHGHGHFSISSAVKFLTLLLCCLVRGLQMLLPVADAGSVAVNAVSLAGLYSRFIVLGRRYSAGLRAGGLNLLAAGARCAIGKSLFNTGVMLYLVGLGVLLLLGLISDSQTSRARTPDASAILYENTGSFTAALKRSVIVPMVLATVYWHWAHSMAGNWQG